jgi:phosphomannomutase
MDTNVLKFTISGLRGVWACLPEKQGGNLNEETVTTYITAFAHFLQKRQKTGTAPKILLGHDARKSGPIIKGIVLQILTRAGIDVIDSGLLPTPTVIFLTKTMHYDGAIMLTASHNPPEYNGIKFITERALFANQKEVDEMKSYLGKPLAEAKVPGKFAIDHDLGEHHTDHILEHINRTLIQEKKFTVVLDAINSVGCYMGPTLLEALGCRLVVLNGVPNGAFAHMPEPLPENLTELGKMVAALGADIGFALDPDGDRLVVCDETGTVVSEEYTLSLAMNAVLKKTPGDIVTNLSTTNTNKDLVESFGFKNYRTKVGEANVVEGIIKHNAIIGGEGGGGVIYPKVNLARDGFVGMALILESLALEEKTVSQIIDGFSKYIFIKEKMPFSGDLSTAIQKVITLFPDGIVDRQDGLRIDFADSSWIQLRASNTEPIIRIYAEGKDDASITEKVELVKQSL